MSVAKPNMDQFDVGFHCIQPNLRLKNRLKKHIFTTKSTKDTKTLKEIDIFNFVTFEVYKIKYSQGTFQKSSHNSHFVQIFWRQFWEKP